MKAVSRIALGLALALGGVSMAAAAQNEVPALSPEERAALLALDTAITSKNYAAASAALNPAQAAAKSGYARYLASSLQLKLAIETNNLSLQETAIDAILGSGSAPAADLPALYRNQGALALGRGKLEAADTAFTRWAEAAPNDADALVALAEVKNLRKQPAEAVPLIDRAISIRQTAGQKAPESWYKRGLKHAFDGRMTPQSTALGRGLVAAYPTAPNWRDVLLNYRDLGQPDPAAAVDIARLMRSSKAFGGERDYLKAAQAFTDAGLHAEAKAVLDEGVAAKMVDPGKATFKELIASSGKRATAERSGLKGQETKALAATSGTAALAAGDAYFGAGDYAKAAELYRAAIQKGSIDANVANTRLGAALAMAGQKTDAEAALRAVNGPRADLASLWLVWLGQHA